MQWRINPLTVLPVQFLDYTGEKKKKLLMVTYIIQHNG